jgi:D-glycero-D-manno-heptose 1,7-bisphosphate phosphatase
MPLIILDRDGVINEDSDDYIRCLADWLPIPGSIEAIARLSGAGFTVTVATNQSGLSRGYFDLDQLEAIHARLRDEVAALGGELAGIFYCPHLPQEGCACRKPGTGLLDAIGAELGVRVRGAILVGDSLKDLQAARAAGCRPMLVKTGKGRATLETLHAGECELVDPLAIPVFDNLAAAADSILQAAPAPKHDG